MPLTLTPIDHDDLCHGWRWEIADETDLARKVAMVALGQYRHVAQILAGIDKKPFRPSLGSPHTAAKRALSPVRRMPFLPTRVLTACSFASTKRARRSPQW
jgi:hypothetical protein